MSAEIEVPIEVMGEIHIELNASYAKFNRDTKDMGALDTSLALIEHFKSEFIRLKKENYALKKQLDEKTV